MEAPLGLTKVQSFKDVSKETKLIAEGSVFKVTAVSDLVVVRKIRLYPEKFYTFHDYDRDPSNKKSWYLDRKCELTPRKATDIAIPTRKSIRPHGTWTITATVTGKGRSVQLYMFTIAWPTSWAAKGYTSFTFGFETLESARMWHRHFQACISFLKERSLVRRGKLAAPGPDFPIHSSRPSQGGELRSPTESVAPDTINNMLNGGAASAPINRMSTNVPGMGMPDDGMSVMTAADDPLFYEADNNDPGYASIQRGVAVGRLRAEAEAEELLMSGAAGDGVVTAGGMSHPIAGAESDSEEEFSPEQARKARREQQRMALERWVPYKQTNGVAVYYHAQNDESTGVGGEYMVSAVVRGPPSEVLDVLKYGSANTTILGPAQKLEVLECTTQDDNTTKELMRITIQAPGLAGVLCAPRVVLVERVLKQDEGLYCVLFTNADEARGKENCYKCSLARASSVPEPSRDAVRAVQKTEASSAQGMARSLWGRWPVHAKVRGGYTIAPLQEYTLSTSPESLLTCIIKMDLGGACGERSWLRPVSDLMGWREAFLDRILMGVILVRDEVEHGRFVHQPFQMVSGQASVPKQPSLPTPWTEGPETHRAMGASRFFMSATKGHGAAAAAGANGLASAMSGAHSTALQSTELSSGASMARVGSRVAGRAGSLNGQQASALDAAPTSPSAASAGGGVEPSPPGAAILDIDRCRSLATLDLKVWKDFTHAGPGSDAPFVVRGPTYLKDKKKIPAGLTQFVHASMECVELPYAVQHVARFLPSVRESGVPFAFIINLVIPGNPLLGIIAMFATEQHPDTILRNPPRHPMEEDHDWQPFDFVLHKYLHGTDDVRNRMLKLIPHIADGSWVIKSSVGTTPVILGKALKTTYHVTPQYIEVDIDISANNVASYVTGLVRGATKSLVIDMGFVLEGTAPWELPEALLGTLRLNYLDIKNAKKLDCTKEIPLRPPTYVTPANPSDGGAPAASGTPVSGEQAVVSPTGFTPTVSVPATPSASRDPSTAEVVQQQLRGSAGGGPFAAAGLQAVSAQVVAAGGAAAPGPTSNSGLAGPMTGGSGSFSTLQPSSSTTTFGMRHRGHSRSPSCMQDVVGSGGGAPAAGGPTLPPAMVPAPIMAAAGGAASPEQANGIKVKEAGTPNHSKHA